MPAALVITVLFLAFSALAQQPWRSVFMGKAAPISSSEGTSDLPGTTPGYPVLVDYTADTYVTNGSMTVLPDNWTNHWDCTNSGATLRWATSIPSALNGHNAIYEINNIGALTNDTFSATSPHEIWLVGSVTNVASGPFFLYSLSSTVRNYLGAVTPNFRQGAIGGATFIAGSLNGMTNKYIMWRFSFVDGASQWWTNGVSVVSGNLPTTAVNGLMLMNNLPPSTGGNCALVALRVFSTNLTVAAANTMSNYWYTNYFPAGFP